MYATNERVTSRNIEQLNEYLENTVSKWYENNDSGHRMPHIREVWARAQRIVETIQEPIDEYILKTAVYFHDSGIQESHRLHHIVGARILMNDRFISRMFTRKEMDIMAIAVTDHRSSINYEPRNIYAKILSDADRDLDPVSAIYRFATVIVESAFIYRNPTGQHHSEYWTNLITSGREVTEFDIRNETFIRLRDKYTNGGRGLKLWVRAPEQVAALKKISDAATYAEVFDVYYEKIDIQSLIRKTVERLVCN